MNYLETLVQQWLDYRGYLVRSNLKVGVRQKGGHEGEIDIAAYYPATSPNVSDHCLHIECSLDASSWEQREKRFTDKFVRGRKYIPAEVFPWRGKDKDVEQWAVVWSAQKDRPKVGGGKVVTLERLFLNISADVLPLASKNHTVHEKYFLLRSMQDVMRFLGKPEYAKQTLEPEETLLPPRVNSETNQAD